MQRSVGLPSPLKTLDTMTELSSTQLSKIEKIEQKIALNNYRRLLGDEHPITLGCTADLAWKYYDQGRLDEAKVLREAVLVKAKQALKDDAATLVHMTNLALIFSNQNCLEETEMLQVAILDKQRKVEGEEASFIQEELVHRRGSFPAVNVGIVLGPGATLPSRRRVNGHNNMVDRLLSDKDMQRLASHQNAVSCYFSGSGPS